LKNEKGSSTGNLVVYGENTFAVCRPCNRFDWVISYHYPPLLFIGSVTKIPKRNHPCGGL